MALINWSIMHLQWPFLSLFLLICFLNSQLFQYLNGFGTFFLHYVFLNVTCMASFHQISPCELHCLFVLESFLCSSLNFLEFEFCNADSIAVQNMKGEQEAS